MRPRRLPWVLAGGVVVAACLGSDAATPADPMLGLEIAAFVLTTAFAIRLATTARRGKRLMDALEPVSEPASRFGVPYERLRSPDLAAFAVGMLRPRIYLSEGVEGRLSEQELRAVLLHEEHHRTTRAPLRGAALEAWLGILGRVTPVRGHLVARLVDLECSADAHAIGRGIAPSVLASALVKTAGAVPAPLGARGFADFADQRVAALLDVAAGRPTRRRAAPLEWLPATLAAALIVGCHLISLPLPH